MLGWVLSELGKRKTLIHLVSGSIVDDQGLVHVHQGRNTSWTPTDPMEPKLIGRVLDTLSDRTGKSYDFKLNLGDRFYNRKIINVSFLSLESRRQLPNKTDYESFIQTIKPL